MVIMNKKVLTWACKRCKEDNKAQEIKCSHCHSERPHNPRLTYKRMMRDKVKTI